MTVELSGTMLCNSISQYMDLKQRITKIHMISDNVSYYSHIIISLPKFAQLSLVSSFGIVNLVESGPFFCRNMDVLVQGRWIGQTNRTFTDVSLQPKMNVEIMLSCFAALVYSGCCYLFTLVRLLHYVVSLRYKP